MSQFNALLSELLDQVKRLAEKFEGLLERVAKLERDGDWNGQERRKGDERFKSGDQTFQLLTQKIANAENRAKTAEAKADSAKASLKDLRDRLDNASTENRKNSWKLADKVVAALIGGLGFAGAKLIEWMMK